MPCNGKYCAEQYENCPRCKRQTNIHNFESIGPRNYASYVCEHHKPKYKFKVRLFSKQELRSDRAQRRAIFIARATAHFDTPKIRKEAAAMFDKANPIKQ